MSDTTPVAGQDAVDTSSEQQPENGQPPRSKPDTGDQSGDTTDWKSLAEQHQRDAEKWRTLARKHEDRAKANADAASKAKTVEEQLAELRKAMADRDVADVKRAGRLAMAQVMTSVAEAGLSREDVAPLLEGYDTARLLADGEPDEKAIAKLAASLKKVAGRTTPDRDQGRRGGDAPPDMNTIIRRAAGVIT